VIHALSLSGAHLELEDRGPVLAARHNRRTSFRFHIHQAAIATTTHITVAAVITRPALWLGKNAQANHANANKATLPNDAPAASAAAACLPRLAPLNPFFFLLSRSCFSTSVTLAARIAGKAKKSPPTLGPYPLAIAAAPAVTSPPRTKRVASSYHLLCFSPDVLIETSM
jgi:hypothetical protein